VRLHEATHISVSLRAQSSQRMDDESKSKRRDERITMTKQRKPMVDAGFKFMNLTHKAALRVTGGRWPKRLFGMPGVELHTVGRKSGERRSTMLATPVHDDSRVVLVASKGGDDRDPQWYRNLRANPEVEITMDGVTRPMRARTASPEEKASLWPEIVAAYKGYEGYQQKAHRDIPVVILEPRTG
jgi:deazaflavin-dependent oxidoreductase (nitroreductase family)